jgi:hypothetical protein
MVLQSEKVAVENIFGGKSAGINNSLKEHLPIINCECGAEILVLPDFQAMNRAINSHVAEHRKKGRIAKDNIDASSRINQLLSQRLLRKISEQNKAQYEKKEI